MSGFDKHAPTRSISPKHLPSPWLMEDIKARMAERDRAERDRAQEIEKMGL